MKHINWSRHLLAGLVAEVVLLSAFALLFGNPISRGIIYTPQAGQSEKLLAIWGVRLRPRLMHDGASLTFIDAILRHQGEAEEVIERFKNLARHQQQDLIEFLRSL